MMLGLLTSAVLGGGVAVGGYKLLETAPGNSVQTTVASDPQVRYTSALRSSTYAAPEGLNFVAAAAATTPAVVHVMTEYKAEPQQRSQRMQMDPLFRQFFGDQFDDQMRGQQPQGGGEGSGSGVIIAANGYIVTNNHVVGGASRIQVTLADGRIYDAKLTGTDQATDLAVIALENPPSDLTVAQIGDSSGLVTGQDVMAIGNPLGLSSTATTGAVGSLVDANGAAVESDQVSTRK